MERLQNAIVGEYPMSLPAPPSFIENLPRFRQAAPVNFKRFLFLALVVTLSGCQKAQPPVNPPETNSLPTEAQPRLKTMKIYLGAETLDAELALTQDQQQTGLMFRTNITDDTAMLFVLPQPLRAPNGFWMTNCPISLSAAYINPNGIVEEIHHLEKNDIVPVVAAHDDIFFVLEVNDGWFARHHINPGTIVVTEHGPLADTFSRRR